MNNNIFKTQSEKDIENFLDCLIVILKSTDKNE
jgi:hypothetical protein